MLITLGGTFYSIGNGAAESSAPPLLGGGKRVLALSAEIAAAFESPCKGQEQQVMAVTRGM